MGQEMTFLEHLEALRWHLWRALVAILLGALVAFLSKRLLFHEIILAPTRVDFFTYRQFCFLGERLLSIKAFCLESFPFILQSRRMAGQFTMHVTASLGAGIISVFPYVFWEIWRFIRPGLLPKEQNILRLTTGVVSVLFFAGVLFGYFILVPISVQFLGHYSVDRSVLNEFDIVSYVSTVVMLVLFSGLAFQLPVVIFFLTKIGFLTSALLRAWRRYAWVVILIISAMITPPDPFSQLFIAFPLLLLYECGIWVSRGVERREQRDSGEQGKQV